MFVVDMEPAESSVGFGPGVVALIVGTLDEDSEIS